MKLQDLKRGMRCTTRDEDVFIVGSVIIDNAYENCIAYLTVSKNSNIGFNNMNEDLTGGDSNNDIVRVEDITMDGYKTIWEREEPKYYLRLPNHDKDASLNYLNADRTSGLFYIENNVTCITLKTQFTQEEIDKLPNQDFIQSLEKEEVE